MSRHEWYLRALGVSVVALVVAGLPVMVAAQETPLHRTAAAGDKELRRPVARHPGAGRPGFAQTTVGIAAASRRTGCLGNQVIVETPRARQAR